MTGNKWLDEVDYAALGHSPLTFTRHYNSNGGYQYQGYFGVSGITQNPLGPRWTHSYYQGLVVTADEVQYRRNNGQTFSFKLVAGRWIPDADVDYRLHERMTNGIRIGWLVTTPAGRIETYSALGDLLKITERDGGYQIFTYSCKTQGPSCPVATPPAIAPDAGLLIRVSDNFGRSLNFTYNQFGKMASMTDPSGKITLYQYGSGDALKVVVYPDDTPTVSTDNPKKTYIYGGDTDEQVNTAGIEQPYVLTGIVDEIGVRYMTYQYDAEGRAVNEYSIGDIDKYHLDFATDGFHTNVMDPSGTVRAHTTTMVLGVMQPSGTSQPKVVNQAGVTTCPASDSNIEYNDTTGNVTSRTDFKNHKTCYQYEIDTLATGRNLETARVEGLDRDAVCATVLADSTLSASPTNSIRKISTEWHPSYHLPTKIAEPNRLTTNVYDASGNLQSRSELATNDSTGAKGFAATGIGTARTWNYIYHTFGRIKREDGPRTDITTDVTNYEYYPDDDPDLSKRGNLKEIVRPLGQTTTFNSYNLNGQPTQITAPNKVVTELAYHPRGWLETLTVKDQGGNNAETTEYAYYPTGLLQLVTLPDKTRLKYLYDPAHRLIEIQQLDNNLKAENVVAKVHYELDAMGNRKEEEYRDPAGNLKRNIVRAYDALNRLQTVTGADQ